MIGDVAYEEVQHLRGLGLIHTEPKGSTLELTTTRRFAEYFGIASTKPEEIRRFLEQKLGVTPTVPAAVPSVPESSDAPRPPGPAGPEAPPEAPPPENPPEGEPPAEPPLPS
jgi:segregation and condensation protein B